MIKCHVCGNEYKRINSFHLKKHNIKNESEYLSLYPDAVLYDDDYIKDISEKTKIAMMNPDIRKTVGKYKRTDTIRKNLSIELKKRHERGCFDNAYTEERNKKISEAKIEYWKTANKDNLFPGWVGSVEHIEMNKKNQPKASRAAFGIYQSKPERDYEEFLIENGISYIKQYKVGKYYFDFYIENDNMLIEIDGKFYHPLTEKDCKYEMQKRNFKRDKNKSELAKSKGYNLKRIRV